MANSFQLDFGGTPVVAALLDDVAPNVTAAFSKCLPLEAFSIHAKFAGEELIAMVPFYCNPENEVFHVQPGAIGYYPGRQTICIFYGQTQPFGHVSVFARVVEGLDELRRIGQRILAEGPQRLTLRSADEVNP